MKNFLLIDGNKLFEECLYDVYKYIDENKNINYIKLFKRRLVKIIEKINFHSYRNTFTYRKDFKLFEDDEWSLEEDFAQNDLDELVIEKLKKFDGNCYIFFENIFNEDGSLIIQKHSTDTEKNTENTENSENYRYVAQNNFPFEITLKDIAFEHYKYLIDDKNFFYFSPAQLNLNSDLDVEKITKRKKIFLKCRNDLIHELRRINLNVFQSRGIEVVDQIQNFIICQRNNDSINPKEVAKSNFFVYSSDKIAVKLVSAETVVFNVVHKNKMIKKDSVFINNIYTFVLRYGFLPCQFPEFLLMVGKSDFGDETRFLRYSNLTDRSVEFSNLYFFNSLGAEKAKKFLSKYFSVVEIWKKINNIEIKDESNIDNENIEKIKYVFDSLKYLKLISFYGKNFPYSKYDVVRDITKSKEKMISFVNEIKNDKILEFYATYVAIYQNNVLGLFASDKVFSKIIIDGNFNDKYAKIMEKIKNEIKNEMDQVWDYAFKFMFAIKKACKD